MYEIELDPSFVEDYLKLTKNNQILKKLIAKSLDKLQQNPFYPSLKSHRVSTKKYDNVWSSWVTGDIRVIWTFEEKSQKSILLCLQLGKHSGSSQVYKSKSS